MQWLGTFHSIGTKILRRHAELVGLRSDFTILGTDDQLRLMKQVIEVEGIDEKRWPARQLAAHIDGWKNRGLGPDQVPAGEAGAFANGKGGRLYRAYQERLKVLNAADFGDLLLECLRLWREHPDILEQYQNRFRYMLVDEYQDTNVAQYLWLRLLAQARKNLCCVGDDDQSIYGWRGAEVDNILRFEHDFPGATVIRLERNYRSTGHILSAASGLIAKNQGRLGKTLRTEDEPGEKVTITGAWDSEEEARLIGEEIEALHAKKHSLSEIAILVRISAQMREIEDRLVTLGVPYRVIGGPRFYERAEIRDALAYLRVVNQPADDLAFERIVNVPKRGLGDATIQVLHNHARAARVPLMEAARFIVETDELKPKPRATLRDLLISFGRWAKLSETMIAIRCRPDGAGGIRLHRHVAEGQIGGCGGASGKPQGARALHGGIPGSAELPRACLPRDGGQRERHCRAGQPHDAPCGEGPGIRHRLPARLGGRPASRTSAPSTRAAARASRKSGASPMWASPAPGAGRRSTSPPTGASTACGTRPFRAASSTICRNRMWRSSRRPPISPMAAAMAVSRFDRMQPFSRLVLPDPRLAARPGAPCLDRGWRLFRHAGPANDAGR